MSHGLCKSSKLLLISAEEIGLSHSNSQMYELKCMRMLKVKSHLCHQLDSSVIYFGQNEQVEIFEAFYLNADKAIDFSDEVFCNYMVKSFTSIYLCPSVYRPIYFKYTIHENRHSLLSNLWWQWRFSNGIRKSTG